MELRSQSKKKKKVEENKDVIQQTPNFSEGPFSKYDTSTPQSRVQRNPFTGTSDEDEYFKFFESLQSKTKIEESFKDVYHILQSKNIEDLDSFESLAKDYFIQLSQSSSKNLPYIYTSISKNLVRIVKNKHIRHEFKESRKIFYIILVSLTIHVGWEIISKYMLVSLFSYLYNSNSINIFLDDLKLRMTHSGTNAHTSYTETDEIENRFAFEGYLYYLKAKIYSLIGSNISQHSLDEIKLKFKQLK